MKIGEITESVTVPQLKKYEGDISYKLFKAHCADKYGMIVDADAVSGNERLHHYAVKEGNILLQNKFPNKAIYIDKEHEDMIPAEYYYLIRMTTTKVDPRYLTIYLNSKSFQRKVHPSLLKNQFFPLLKIATLRDTEVPVYSMEKQLKIIEEAKDIRDTLIRTEEAIKYRHRKWEKELEQAIEEAMKSSIA